MSLGDVATSWYAGLSTGTDLTLRMGNRVQIGESGHLKLEVEMQETDDGMSLQGIGLRTGLSW